MQKASFLVSMTLSIAALALTAGCGEIHGLQTYPTEAAATAACGDDQVVYGWFDHKNWEFWWYTVKGSRWYGTTMYHGEAYACLAEMARMGIPCGKGGPVPYPGGPACKREPDQPKA
jgi:hypothetical protein